MAGSIAEFSPVPADNGMSPPIGAPEGATKLKALNDIMRNQNAAARSWYNDPLWRDVRDGTPNATYTFDSANSFRVNSTAALPFYPVGKRLKIVAGGYTRLGYVTSSVVSGSDTVVTCSLDGALTNVAFIVYSAAVEFTSLPGAPAFTAADQLMVSTAAGLVAAMDVPASRFVGKKATGGVSALTAAEAIAILGLGNVENKSSAMIRGELTSGNVTGALGFTPYGASTVINRIYTAGVARGSYGSVSVTGATGGYSGIDLYDAATTVMSSRGGGGSHGFYRDNSNWVFCFNDAGSLIQGSVPWASVTGRPTDNSSFTNGSGYITAAALGGYATTAYVAGNFLSRAVDAWQTSADGRNRLYFGSNGATYVTSSGAQLYFSTDNGGTYPITMYGGTVSAGNFYYTSDETEKDNIVRLDGRKMLGAIRDAGGWSYEKLGEREMGVLAQRMIRAGLGDLIRTGEDGKLKFNAGGSAGPIFAALDHIAERLERAEELLAL